MSQNVCFKWENHPINLLSSLKSFQSSNVLVDVTLSCEGKSLKAHKLILSACSPYFQSLFTENPCQHPIVFMTDMRFEILKAIMDFIYDGKVNVARNELHVFLKAAEALKIKKLTEMCAQYLNSGIDSNAPYAQRVSTPMKKRNRGRKRSLSDSNKSDEDVTSIKQEPLSPESQEIHEISGDEFYAPNEMKLNDGLRLNSHMPMNAYSSSHHQPTRCIIREPDSDEEYEMESSKLLEQTMTSNTSSNNQGNPGLSMSSDGFRIEKKMRSTPDRQPPSNMQSTLVSSDDVKPIIEFEDSSEAEEATMMSCNEQSQPGPSNYKESSLGPQEGSDLHDFMTFEESNVRESIPAEILPFLKQRPELTIFETKQQQPSTSKMMNVYHCELCPFETPSSGAFQSHMEGHKTYKEHDCQICGKVFKTAGRLNAHMQTHEPGQPFVCVYCEKKFKHNSSLKTHMKIHLGIDIHCPLCDKTFTNNAALKKHLVAHHNQMDDYQK